jgi:mRNA-degrading endonuclease RelE of RelBE toxin-antitoxin system
MPERFEIRIKKPARRAIGRLEPSVRSRIRKTLEKLGDTPYLGKPLSRPLLATGPAESGITA